MTTATEQKQSLYEAIKAAGIPYDHHESDLYIKVTAESEAILKRYPLQKRNTTRFISKVEPGGMWFDVPFAYDPFWERTAATADKRK